MNHTISTKKPIFSSPIPIISHDANEKEHNLHQFIPKIIKKKLRLLFIFIVSHLFSPVY